MENRTKKKVAIWCEHAFQLYSAKPVIDKYLKANCEVEIFTFKENVKYCAEYTGIPIGKIKDINSLIQKRTSLLTYIYEILFVDKNYSVVYRERRLLKEKRIFKLISKYTFFLKVKKENVNSHYLKYAKWVNRLGLHKGININCDLLISFTRIRYPLLVSDLKVPHISIMESWDHPVKDPYFIDPDYALVWNKSLKADTQHYQKLKRVAQICPLKFRYIYERENDSMENLMSGIKAIKYISELNLLKDKSVILYPVTTSSEGYGHEGEMELIDQLCLAAQKANRLLYIKPKPNGPAGDYDVFKRYHNVIVGVYSSSTDALDMLDEDYQSFRYCLLKLCDVVVNVGTTFVLEAALTNNKIIQLDLQSDVFGAFTDFTKTLHLKKYILNNKAAKYSGDINNLATIFKKADYEYTLSIRNWITAWQ